MKTTKAFWAIIISATIATAALGQGQVLRRIPSDCLFCVQINNPDEILGRLEQYLSNLQGPGLAIQAKAAIGQMISNPQLLGVRTTGQFIVFGSAPTGKIDDPDSWLQSIWFMVPVTEFGQLASNIPAEQPDANGVRQLTGTGLAIVDAGGYTLIGRPGDRLLRMAAAIRSGPSQSLAGLMDHELLEAAERSGLWAYCNVQVLAKTIGPQISKKIQELGTQVASQAGPNADQLQQICNLYAGLIDYLLGQVSTVTVTARVMPDRLILTKYIRACPDGQLAQALAGSGQPGQLRLLGYCQDGAMICGAWRLQPSRLLDLSKKLIEVISAAIGQKVQQDQISKWTDLTKTLSSTMGEQMAFCISSKPGARPFFSSRQVFEVKDPDAYLKVQRQLIDLVYKEGLLPSLMPVQGPGLQSTQMPDATYKDTKIQVMRITFTFKDPNAMEAQLIKQMYGDGIEFRTAVVDKLGLAVWGQDAQQAMQQLIDQVKSGSPSQGPDEIKKALALVEAKDVDLICTINYLRLFSAAMTALMPIPIQVQSSSNLVIAAKMDNGKAMVQLILPKSHLDEIVDTFKAMAKTTPNQGL
ncbi:MAG: hypothetical protein QHH07_05575 [Sedimentisphaerales bacterium]|nr:hypothetical protein [Sedimentisphaerales bacterium]